MVEVEPHQHLSAKVLQAQGRDPGGREQDETAGSTAAAKNTRDAWRQNP
jgi:hypothetical protein